MTRHPGLAIIVAAVLHALLAIWVAPRFEPDSALYGAPAESLAARGAAEDASGALETRVTPGYPLFLALFLKSGAGYEGAVVAQHLLWVLIVAATTWLVMQATRKPTLATGAGLITTLDLPRIQSSFSILSETLAAATVMAAVCSVFLAVRANRATSALSWSLLAGIAGGITAMVRPIAIAFGVPLAIAILIGADQRWRVRAAALLIAAFAVLPIVWTARNARQTGVATFSSLAGINLLHYRAAATLAIRQPGGIDANLIKQRELLEQQACERLTIKYGRDCASIPWEHRSSTYSEIAWPIILGDPLASFQQAARALGMILLGGGASLLSEVTGISESAARLVCLAYTAPLALLFMAGIPYWWQRDRALTCLLLLVLGYMIGMALGVEAYSRFRVPVIALYGIVCAGGIGLLANRVAARSTRN
jgi:hypothetical protein